MAGLRAAYSKNGGSIPGKNNRFLLSPKRPHLPRGTLLLLFSGYREIIVS